jgi:hypothetical protein
MLKNSHSKIRLQKVVIPLEKEIHAFSNFPKKNWISRYRPTFALSPDMARLPMLGTRSRE